MSFMLKSLSIRNIVLIDRLDLTFEKGLCILTGETGAGKSILLDALSLTLGTRGDLSLISHGSDQAIVTAEFDPPTDHPARTLLKEHGLSENDTLILRRLLSRDGKNRVFINDEPVSLALLKQVAETLIEIHGQFDRLLESSHHRDFLDAYAHLTSQRIQVSASFDAWKAARERLEQARTTHCSSQEKEELLKHYIQELEALDPQAGEEETLAQARSEMMHHGKLKEAMANASQNLNEPTNIATALITAHRSLATVQEYAPIKLTPVMEALDRAALELSEATALLENAEGEDAFDQSHLEETEERLHLLRSLARKHDCAVDELAEKLNALLEELDLIVNHDARLQELEKEEAAARQAFASKAEKLSQARQKAAKDLSNAVLKELPPLKMERALFNVECVQLPEEHWSATGIDRIEFQVAPNGGIPGALKKIASGGERSRFMLALKVALSQSNTLASIVFDEIDAGLGGAVATAVGERLHRLSQDGLQILTITHAPQVAALADHHWRVEKSQKAGGITTSVEKLNLQTAQEEVARMLAGTEITDEARAAASRLMAKAS